MWAEYGEGEVMFAGGLQKEKRAELFSRGL
jgi:hypothetical protein